MTTLKNLPKFDLPREKLLRYGSEKLADHELLAILLGSGIHGKNVLSLAKATLQKISKIGVAKTTLNDLKSIKGLGEVKALQVLAIIELAKRLYDTSPEILSDKDVWNLASDIRGSQKEHLMAFFLNSQQRLIGKQIISTGILDSSLIHPRELFEPAISLHSAGIIIAHNHPSGTLEPSQADIQITKQLIEAGKLLGIPLQRHLIVTKSDYSRVNQD